MQQWITMQARVQSQPEHETAALCGELPQLPEVLCHTKIGKYEYHTPSQSLGAPTSSGATARARVKKEAPRRRSHPF